MGARRRRRVAATLEGRRKHVRHDRVWSGGHFKRRPSFRDQVGRFIVTTLGFLTFGYLGRRTR